MPFASALAIYFVMWWTVLFAVLPWGVRSQAEEGDIVAGSDPGAPSQPRLVRIVLITTAASGVLFGVFYWLWTTGVIGMGHRF
jgi:predicted secreted protein